MAVNLSPVFGVAGQLFDNNGNPLAGGKIFTYLAGTTTNATVYTSSSGTIAHSNPIILDGAGRVPSGEIWLTDGILYKFVVQDSANNLIGTYDNISGINSNFIAFTNQQEIITATAGQTVFNLSISYQPGTNSLSVFVDGVNQYGPGAQYAYVETDQDTVTFVSGLHVGAEVKFTTSQLQSAGAVDASQVSYQPPFANSVATNVEAKLSQYVSPTDFGAAGNGVVNDTTAIASAIANKQSGGVNVVSASAYDYGLLNAGFVNVNTANEATIGTNEILSNGTFTGSATGWTLSNFTYSANTITHTAGTIGTASQLIVVKPFRTYLATITLTTSTFGTVDILVNGTSYLESGYQYAVGSTSNQFALLIPDTGSVNFQIACNTAWAGSIDSISLIEVASEWRPNTIWAATDDTQLRIPQGIKFGRYNAGNISIGDRQTMALIQNAGVWNVAVGARALATNQTGIENTALGTFALQYATTSRNTSVGYSALKYLSTGEQNTGIGFKSFAATAGGSRNTGVGHHSGLGNVSGSGNTYLGWQTGYQAKTASGNTFVGDQAGMAHTGGSNTLVGSLAGYLNADVNILYNYVGTTSIGSESKVYGDNGTAVGLQAKIGNDGATATNAVAVGYLAKAQGNDNTALGANADAQLGTNGKNTAIGSASIASGVEQSTAVGYLSKAAGLYASAFGSQAGIKMAGNENTFLGTSAGNITVNAYTNCTLVGYATDVTGNNQVQLGDSRTTTYAYGAVQNRSDNRDKADVRPTVLGLDFILSLRPVDFKWDYREDYKGQVKDGSKKRSRFHHGLIAQEVKAACDAAGVDFGGYQDHSIDGGKDVLSIGYEELIAPLIKAVQQLSAEVAELKGSKNG
jgi:hypothetical protein